MSVSTLWCACSCGQIHKSPLSTGGCLWGVANHLKEFHREEDQSESTSTQYSQKLEGKLKQFFLPQVPGSYQPEVLRVIRVHGSESNISKNKHNRGQIIFLVILQDCVLYYTAEYMTWYGHLHTYYMLCILNTKAFFPSATWYRSFYKRNVS